QVKASGLPSDKEATLVFYCANEHCQACHSGAARRRSSDTRMCSFCRRGLRGGRRPASRSKTAEPFRAKPSFEPEPEISSNWCYGMSDTGIRASFNTATFQVRKRLVIGLGLGLGLEIKKKRASPL